MRNTLVKEFRCSVSETREIVDELSRQARRGDERSVGASRAAIRDSHELLRRIDRGFARSLPRAAPSIAATLPVAFFLFETEDDARAFWIAAHARVAERA